jgi:hypothetical protein
VLSGAATTWQLESNVGASGVVIPNETSVALQALTMRSEEYWRVRSALPWN